MLSAFTETDVPKTFECPLSDETGTLRITTTSLINETNNLFKWESADGSYLRRKFNRHK